MAKLDFNSRFQIERMLAENISITEIAKAVGISRQTLYRELSRCKGNTYSAIEAQNSIFSGRQG